MRRRSWHHNSDLKADKRVFYRILSQPGQTTVTPARLSSLGGQVLHAGSVVGCHPADSRDCGYKDNNQADQKCKELSPGFGER